MKTYIRAAEIMSFLCKFPKVKEQADFEVENLKESVFAIQHLFGDTKRKATALVMAAETMVVLRKYLTMGSPGDHIGHEVAG